MVSLPELSSFLAATGPDLPRAAGRLHPLLVHFPVALALVAIGAEWWRGVRRIEGMSPLTMPLLWLAAVSAIGATATGWLNAAHEHDGSTDPTLDRHRWIGTATTVALLGLAWWGRSLCASLVHPTAEAFARLGAFRWMAAVVAVAVGLTGHLGGELVYGKNYVGKVLFPPAAKPTEPPTDAPVAEPAALTPSELHFVERVRPLLEVHCLECHGSRRQRGGLRMDSKEALFEGEEYEWSVIPGKSAESEVFKRVVLGRDDPDAMPPEGPGLSQDEIDALRKWIDEGAVEKQRMGEARHVTKHVRRGDAGLRLRHEASRCGEPLPCDPPGFLRGIHRIVCHVVGSPAFRAASAAARDGPWPISGCVRCPQSRA